MQTQASPSAPPLWRRDRADFLPILLVVALPVLAALPRLLGLLAADPMLAWGEFNVEFRRGYLPGWAHIDPNAAYTTQALGYRAALDWLAGTVPWWNPYSGVGLPLAGEYQPAAFFPLTLLLLAPHGMTLQHVALQVLAGLGTYGLLRQTGAGTVSSCAGAIVYAFSGTLALFAHGPAQPVPFLPWMLWGIERAFSKAGAHEPGGWRMLAAAMAMSLLAGFPETAYFNGLLALAWTVVRGVQCQGCDRAGFSSRIVVGGLTGIAIASPQVVAFLQVLQWSDIGDHGHRFAHEALGNAALLPSVIAPFVHGPIFAFIGERPETWHMWGGIGGYTTFALLLAAVFGLFARRGALAAVLAVWILLALGKSFGVQPAVAILNAVPAVTLAAFYRYAPPSWELALIVLAAWGLDARARGQMPSRGAWIAVCTVFAAGLACLALLGAPLWKAVSSHVAMRNWAAGSVAWAVITAIAIAIAMRFAPAAHAARAIAAILAVDAMFIFSIPTLSNPRLARIDAAAVGFLQANLGMQRYFTLGPIAPNYGAYFGIASVNHNYLPAPQRWIDWMRANLDRGNTDPPVFDGKRREGERPAVNELRANLDSYRRAGVKYVVAPPGLDPLPGHPRVYESPVLTIVEVTDPSPYFEAIGGPCEISAASRTLMRASCQGPARLVRRELFFPGWTALVEGREARIVEHGEIFQAVDLPAGKHEVAFRYAPPGIGWAWLAALAGLSALLVPTLRRRKP